jgi:WD domain, G-beta repeat.
MSPRPTASWTKLYQMAHTKDIKDLKWLPYFDDNGEMVFASCSEDGDTKIWTLEDNYTPVYTFSPTKALIE